MGVVRKKYWWKAIISSLLVLATMPLGHALMIMMEHLMDTATLHYVAFAMGVVGLVIVIRGVFASGDVKQTLLGLFGGLLFRTGWVEFLFVYYAHRFEVRPESVNGEVVTKPEYLIMPSSFGFWMMFIALYDKLCLYVYPSTAYRFVGRQYPYGDSHGDRFLDSGRDSRTFGFL